MIDYRNSVLVDRDIVFEVDGKFQWLYNEDLFMEYLQNNFASIDQIKFVIVNSYADEDEVKFCLKNNGSLDLNELHLDDDYDDFAELDVKEGKLYFDNHCEQAKFMREHGFEHLEEKITSFLDNLNQQKQTEISKTSFKQNGEHEIMDVDEITTALISQDFSLDNLEPAKQFVGQVDTEDLTQAVGRALMYQQNQDWLENSAEDELKDEFKDLSVSDAVDCAKTLADSLNYDFNMYNIGQLEEETSDMNVFDILRDYHDVDVINDSYYKFDGEGKAHSLSEEEACEEALDALEDMIFYSHSLEDVIYALPDTHDYLSDVKDEYETLSDANRVALEHEDYHELDNLIYERDYLEIEDKAKEVVEQLKQEQTQAVEQGQTKGRGR